jgi:hypothetical protein
MVLTNSGGLFMRTSTSSLNLDFTDQHGADVSADVSTDVSAQSPPQLLRGRPPSHTEQQQSLQLQLQLQQEQLQLQQQLSQQNLAISADSGDTPLQRSFALNCHSCTMFQKLFVSD